MNKTILILGACGQIGTELTLALRQKYGNDHVVASDIRQPEHSELLNGPFEVLDASSASALRSVCEKHEMHTVYHLVAMLSATGEKFPMKAWDLNMQSLLHVLELAREKGDSKTVLAQLYCGIWTYYTKAKHSAANRYGTFNGLWHFETCGRALV